MYGMTQDQIEATVTINYTKLLKKSGTIVGIQKKKKKKKKKKLKYLLSYRNETSYI
jgi:hypothetical protein